MAAKTGGDDVMPAVDVENLDPRLARLAGDMNRRRQNEARLAKKRGVTHRMMGLGLTAGVFAIYFYTMFAMRQESVLDDLDKKVILERQQQKQSQ